MKKYGLCLLAGLMAVVATFAVLFLCTHGSMLPEKVTEYYELKAKTEAETMTGAEAELMALLLGAAPAAPAEETAEISSFSFQTSPFSLFLAVMLLLSLLAYIIGCSKNPDRHKGVLWTCMLAAPLGLIGARLLYCLTDITFYLRDIEAPLAMLKIWEGGLSVMGALAGITLAGVLGAKIAGEKPMQVLNRLAPLMLAFAATVACANVIAGAGWGPEASVPLLSTLVNERPRLNTALLTALMLIVLWLLLHFFFRKNLFHRRFLCTAFLFGVLMVLLESLRRDGHMVWGFVHAEMMCAMLIFFPAALCLVRKNRILATVGTTALLAGGVIGLEFMLDRSAIADGLLYIVYILFLTAYIFVTLKWANRSCEAAENNV